MNRRPLLGLAVVTCAISVGWLTAADDHTKDGAKDGAKDDVPSPTLYLIVAEHVKPSMIIEYEKATKELIDVFTEHEVDPETVSFHTVQGPEIGYVYAMRMKDFAAMDGILAGWQAAVETIGAERWKELAGRADAAIDRREVMHVMSRPDLSYRPEHPDSSGEEVQHLSYGYYYAIPGREEEMEAAAREYVELYARHGLPYGWTTFQGITGGDLPLYVVIDSSRSPKEHWEHAEKTEATLGDEGRKLGMKALGCMRRYERKEGRPRPDLSYPRPDAE